MTAHPDARRPANSGSGIKKRLRDTLLEWDTAGVDELTFFSCYDLDVNGRDKLVKNEYTHCRRLMRDTVASDEVWFIGSPLVDQSYLSPETYVRYLAKVKEHFPGKQIVYIAHPRDSAAGIEMSQRTLGSSVQRFDIPIECALTGQGLRPACLASFFSSALDTCSVIFSDLMNFKAFHLPGDDLLKEHETVQDVYSHYRSRPNIEIVY